nr:Caab080 [Calliteara abietis nucleopolyhedrovirus]
MFKSARLWLWSLARAPIIVGAITRLHRYWRYLIYAGELIRSCVMSTLRQLCVNSIVRFILPRHCTGNENFFDYESLLYLNKTYVKMQLAKRTDRRLPDQMLSDIADRYAAEHEERRRRGGETRVDDLLVHQAKGLIETGVDKDLFCDPNEATIEYFAKLERGLVGWVRRQNLALFYRSVDLRKKQSTESFLQYNTDWSMLDMSRFNMAVCDNYVFVVHDSAGVAAAAAAATTTIDQQNFHQTSYAAIFDEAARLWVERSHQHAVEVFCATVVDLVRRELSPHNDIFVCDYFSKLFAYELFIECLYNNVFLKKKIMNIEWHIANCDNNADADQCALCANKEFMLRKLSSALNYHFCRENFSSIDDTHLLVCKIIVYVKYTLANIVWEMFNKD